MFFFVVPWWHWSWRCLFFVAPPRPPPPPSPPGNTDRKRTAFLHGWHRQPPPPEVFVGHRRHDARSSWKRVLRRAGGRFGECHYCSILSTSQSERVENWRCYDTVRSRVWCRIPRAPDIFWHFHRQLRPLVLQYSIFNFGSMSTIEVVQIMFQKFLGSLNFRCPRKHKKRFCPIWGAAV